MTAGEGFTVVAGQEEKQGISPESNMENNVLEQTPTWTPRDAMPAMVKVQNKIGWMNSHHGRHMG